MYEYSITKDLYYFLRRRRRKYLSFLAITFKECKGTLLKMDRLIIRRRLCPCMNIAIQRTYIIFFGAVVEYLFYFCNSLKKFDKI